MRNLVLAIFFICVTACTPSPDIQSQSVIVLTSDGNGSGTLVTKSSSKGYTTFVITAAHLFSEPTGISVGQSKNNLTTIFPAKLVLVLPKEDIAVLVVNNNYFKSFPKFGDTPQVGDEVYHVGSMLGWFGHNSVTRGIVSYINRNDPNETDQVSCPIFSGSSGGGVYNSDKEYVGMITQIAFDHNGQVIAHMGYMIPIRKLRTILIKHKFGFLVRNEPVPQQLLN